MCGNQIASSLNGASPVSRRSSARRSSTSRASKCSISSDNSVILRTSGGSSRAGVDSSSSAFANTARIAIASANLPSAPDTVEIFLRVIAHHQSNKPNYRPLLPPSQRGVSVARRTPRYAPLQAPHTVYINMKARPPWIFAEGVSLRREMRIGGGWDPQPPPTCACVFRCHPACVLPSRCMRLCGRDGTPFDCIPPRHTMHSSCLQNGASCLFFVVVCGLLPPR